jgi:hypothetical protein
VSRNRRAPAGHLIALALACIGLLLRAAIPAGFMLGEQPSGEVGVIVCPGGMTPAEMAMMPGHGDHSPAEPAHAPKQGQSDHACTFLQSAAAVDDVLVFRIARPAPVAAPVETRIGADQRPGLGLAAPPPPKTAPPVHA